jgi:hypothetical protein
MIDESTAEEMLQALRRGLADRGDAGQFLLGEIDRALSSGIEELQDEFTETKSGASRRTGKQVVVKRAPRPSEALLIHIGVLEAYLVDTERAAESALRDLARHAPVESILLISRSDVESNVIENELPDVFLGNARLSENWAISEAELRKLRALVLGEERDEHAPTV